MVDFHSMSLDDLESYHTQFCMIEDMEYRNEERLRKNKLGHVINDHGGECDIDEMISILKREKRLVEHLQRNVKSILSINAGNGKCEQHFCSELFPNAKVIHSDIEPPCKEENYYDVKEMSAFDAIQKIPSDMVLCFMPSSESNGYLDLVPNLKSKYFVFLGPLEEGGPCDPCYDYDSPRGNLNHSLVQQLKYEMKLHWIATVNRHRQWMYEHLAIFEKVSPDDIESMDMSDSRFSHLESCFLESQRPYGPAKMLEEIIKEKVEESKNKRTKRTIEEVEENKHTIKKVKLLKIKRKIDGKIVR